MLFKPEDLSYNSYDPIQEAADILNESVYLDESESVLSPVAIPVVENARIGACVVAFNDVERLAEDHGVDYIEAMQAVAEANELTMDHLAVSVPEWKIIANPSVVNELSNVVVAPLSSKDPVSQLCEMFIDTAINEDDMSYVDLLADVLCEDARADKLASMEKELADLKSQYSSADQWNKKALDDKIKAKMKSIETIKKYAEKNDKATSEFNKKQAKKNEERDTNTFKGMGYTDEQIKKGISGKSVAGKIKYMNAQDAKEAQKNQPLLSDSADDKNSDGAKKLAAQGQELIDQAKKMDGNTDKGLISKLISKLKAKYQSIKNSIPEDPKQRSIFQKLLHAITAVIDRISKFLS